MKEITYTNFDDYIEKSKAFGDPKVVKVFTIWDSGEYGKVRICKVVTFLRTWLIQWQGKFSNEIFVTLTGCGHKEGKLQDVVPLGRAI